MAHVKESCHVRKKHVVGRVLLWVGDRASYCSCEQFYVARGGVMTHMKESCQCEEVMLWGECCCGLAIGCRIARVNSAMLHEEESCHTCKSHVTHERVMSHMKESCHVICTHKRHQQRRQAEARPLLSHV